MAWKDGKMDAIGGSVQRLGTSQYVEICLSASEERDTAENFTHLFSLSEMSRGYQYGGT